MRITPSMLLRQSTAVTLVACMAVSGCTLTGNSLRSQYGNTSGSDSCAAYREPLIQTEDEFNTPILQGVVIGALVGTAAGALAGGNAQSAAIGAAAGALAGGALGYYSARQQQAKNQEDLLAAIDSDARGDQGRFSRIGNAVTALGNCRQGQIADVRAKLTAAKITKEQAKTELQSIEQSVFFDNELIGKVYGTMDSRLDTYAQARAKATNSSVDTVLANSTAPAATAAAAPTSKLSLIQKSATVRGTPSSTGKRLGTISPNTAVEVLETTSDGKWSRIHFGGSDSAYVASSVVGSAPAAAAVARPAAPPPQPANAVQSLARSKSEAVTASSKANENIQHELAAARALI